MNAGEWIALAALFVTVVGGMLALWFQGGRILERLDHMQDAQRDHKRRLDEHERRLQRVELIIEPLK